jgi:hypothetical protein
VETFILILLDMIAPTLLLLFIIHIGSSSVSGAKTVKSRVVRLVKWFFYILYLLGIIPCIVFMCFLLSGKLGIIAGILSLAVLAVGAMHIGGLFLDNINKG